jgi:hypothetical protein
MGEAMSDSVTIKLEYPVEYGKGGEVITEVTLRRPRGRDVRNIIPANIMTMTFEEVLTIAARCMDRSKEFCELMDGKDCVRVVGEIYSFFGCITGA